MSPYLKEIDLDKYIYRIISLERLLELFATNENTLVKPELWDDTFENFILKRKVKQETGEIKEFDLHNYIFGQCWTLASSSDAMWRIYSPNKDGIRIRVKVRDLISSLHDAQSSKWPKDMTCCIGKVEYLSEDKLMERANSTFSGNGIEVGKIFGSLLLKRKAFEHENEVRLLYQNWETEKPGEIYRYKINPHNLISQIMIDPRRKEREFSTLKKIIIKATGYKGDIKRSLLYRLPEDTILDYMKDQA
ncbi:DUF2971 domain-containing protein [Microbulbifer sp. SSSA005]|uniref:DUF2971 domain-containing protein n=1 Tax=unclassified Microbulbifer TaxID=2619833 RepID=UPI00403AB65B